MQIKFGTDGWRGIVGRDFTFANVRRMAAAIGAHLSEKGIADRGVAVGFDRRFQSDEFGREVGSVLNSMGVRVFLGGGPLPTPVLSWAVRERGLAAGVMVTASHNPYEWNGLKLKEGFGGSSLDATNRGIEKLLADKYTPVVSIETMDPATARRKGLLEELDVNGYCESLETLVDFDAISSGDMRVVVDPMHGCGTGWLGDMLRERGVEVVELRSEWNPGFGGTPPEPVEKNLAPLLAAMDGFNLGLATDGDADRIGAADERGRYFSPQRILAIFAYYLAIEKGHEGLMAKAVSATAMLDGIGESVGAKVVTVPVGFKNVVELMLREKVMVGGEESGGIGLGAHIPERDGILNGLILAEIAVKKGGIRNYLDEVFAVTGYFTYDRHDLKIDRSQADEARGRLTDLDVPQELCGIPVESVSTLDGVKIFREDGSWLLLRGSGTEPLVRVYAEARSRADVDALLASGRELLGIK